MIENKAIVFDIQRNSFVDGPGIRTTVFFKGCNLRCTWCHNPESQSQSPQLTFYPSKCTNCGRCKIINPYSEDFFCPNDAKELCGKEYTVNEILKTVLKDKAFYAASGGGVTFSGGECMLQIDVLEELLRKCRENGIHTAIDTAGHVPYELFERILPYTDLFLYDVKCYDSDLHKKYTGVGNELILDNLKKLLATKIPVWVRIPVIPSVNDTAEEMKVIHEFLTASGSAKKVELLPYHAMGEHKYAAIGKATPSFSVPTDTAMEQLEAIFADLHTEHS